MRPMFVCSILSPKAWSCVALLCLLIGAEARAAIQIPTGMKQGDRAHALRVIGFDTSAKLLSDPYPLGGYAGFEAGISVESFNVGDLGGLGNGLSSPQGDITVPQISLGKGLFNDVDIFLHFTPYNRNDELSIYGGMMRWNFFEAKYWPITASLIGNLSSSNFSNKITSRSYGFDFVGGATFDWISLFAGFGIIEATGIFTSGPNGVTDSTATSSPTTTEVERGLHSLAGFNLHYSNYFLVAQFDHYDQTTYSAKLGLRF